MIILHMVAATKILCNIDRHGGVSYSYPDLNMKEGVVMKRYGKAKWQGGLKDGKGVISTESGVLDNTQYSFSTRFAEGKGTNPEELIGAAHAGCFSMAFAAQLEKAGYKINSIKTTATVTLEQADNGFSIPAILLTTEVDVPEISKDKLDEIAHAAKIGCPVSKLMNAKITLELTSL